MIIRRMEVSLRAISAIIPLKSPMPTLPALNNRCGNACYPSKSASAIAAGFAVSYPGVSVAGMRPGLWHAGQGLLTNSSTSNGSQSSSGE